MIGTVQPASMAAAFADALHTAGLPVNPERAGRFARALMLAPPRTVDRLYWMARISLVSDHSQLGIFDALFTAVFTGVLDPAEQRGDPTAPSAIQAQPRPRSDSSGPVGRQQSVTGDPPPRIGGDGAGDGADCEREGVLAVAGSEERLGDTSFAELTDDEVTQMRRLVQRIVLAAPLRLTRRTRATHRVAERIDVRRTLRRAQRTGGDPVRPVHRTRRRRPRRLVLLCDVSGSMEPYARVFLSLLQGAVSGASAEAFVFSTRLTRLTRALAVQDPDEALARAAAAAPDWSGGTRLAESLRRFVTDHGRRGIARGAVVVILSDGWATDEPADVAVQMARLRRLAYRIVWVNPRQAAPGFAPTVGGMAAALPFCDAFVSGHSYAALEELAAAVAATRNLPPVTFLGERRHHLVGDHP